MSTLNTPHLSFLESEPSMRLRTLLRNACSLFDCAVWQVLEELGLVDVIADSTAARSFTKECTTRIRRDYAERYLDWLSGRANFDRTVLTDYVLTGQSQEARILILAADEVFPHTAARLAAWNRRLTNLINGSQTCWLLTNGPSVSMLPERARQPLLRALTSTMEGPFHAFQVENDFALRRMKSLAKRHEMNRVRPFQVLSRVGVEEAMKQLPHADQRDVLIETLLDRHECRHVHLGFIDDRPGRTGWRLRPFLTEFDMRGTFDWHTSARRKRVGLIRFVYVAAESAAQAAMVAEDCSIIGEVQRVAVLDFDAVTDWLLGYASADCWRKRKYQHDREWPTD